MIGMYNFLSRRRKYGLIFFLHFALVSDKPTQLVSVGIANNKTLDPHFELAKLKLMRKCMKGLKVRKGANKKYNNLSMRRR